MSQVDEMIARLCPAGVDFKPMWQLTSWDKKFNAVDRAKQPRVLKYRHFLASDLKPLVTDAGDVKLLTTNSSELWTTGELAGEHVSEGEIIAIPWGGNPNVQYYKGKFLTADNRIAVVNDLKTMSPKFLYYFLIANLRTIGSFYRGSGIKHPSMTHVLDMRIPVPPLEVQREIVRILDCFTELEVELEAELEARRAQYEYYHRVLLSLGTDAALRPLSDLAKNLDNKRKPVTRAARTPGDIPYYGASGIVDYVSDYIFDGEYLLVSEDGANLLARVTPIAFSISGRTWVNNHAHVLEFHSYAERRFVEIYLNSIDLSPFITGAAQPKLNKANLSKVPIPDPPLKEKERIVAILDKFDALVNDPNVGLPAELTARRKQYEHYRDRLLTFKELAG